MNNPLPGSLLHPKIAVFYQIQQNISNKTNVDKYLNSDCTYNWENLEKLLLFDEALLTSDPVYPTTYDEYLKYFQLLTPVFQQSEAYLTQIIGSNDLTDNSWFNKLKWLGNPMQMRKVLRDHVLPLSHTSTLELENNLFLTSVLENSLGNVYYTVTNKSPPHLLRDLLSTRELKDIFGVCPILFLKIIMGSPNSANLRNIVWHGFPLPSELPQCYTAVLLIASASLSTLLKEKQLKLQSRPQVTDFSKFVSKINTPSINLTLLCDLSKADNAIVSSKWTGRSNHKVFWCQILQHYRSGNYWQFIILILPQIELILRRMYGEANDFNINAKLDEYYITMDTIFESSGNRFFSGGVLHKGTQHLLYDIFISPYGMRIRDKVSHGEVNLDCIAKDLCSILLYCGLNLVTSNEDYPLDSYQSRFHLNFLANECLVESRKSVLHLMHLKTPKTYEIEFNWDQGFTASLLEVDIVRPCDIFDRHKKEPEIVAILMRIAQLVVQVCKNYEISFQERFEMFLRHELRSRARKTLDKMVTTMCPIRATLGDVVRCLITLMGLMQTEKQDWFENEFVNIQRFCKHTLKIMENFVGYSDKTSNEWQNALECCKKFQETSSRLKINEKNRIS